MFRRIVGSGPQKEDRARELFKLHPIELHGLLEMAWENRIHKDTTPFTQKPAVLGSPQKRSELSQLPSYMLTTLFGDAPINFLVENRQKLDCEVRWDHLIYAYMIENTRTHDIFFKVLQHYLMGEKLGVPTAESQHWLRNTEMLFFSDPAPFAVYNVRSLVRPDLTATRRNAYYRMFGMDLNHGTIDKKPYNFFKSDASNRDFVSTFEDFLQEVWVGITNELNTSGANRTDNAAIANFARQLHDMLNDRRLNSNLSREEFFFVSMMSWFHLTLEFNSPILIALRAEGNREDQRLYRVAERIGLPAHAKSYDFFQLAEPISRVLTQIELGTFNDENNVPFLFQNSLLEKDIRTIITHWTMATGRDMKVRRGQNISIATNNYRGYTSDHLSVATKTNGKVTT